MKNKLQFMFGLMFAALSLSLCVSAQGIGDRNRPTGEGSYRIMGKVYLPDGTPARNADVSAGGAGFSGGSARTDADGNFVISGVAGGNYQVTARLKGYQNANESLTIAKDTTSGQAFQLVFHLRALGDAKPASKTSANFADVPPAALAKYEEALQLLTKNDAQGALPLLDQAIKAYSKFAAAYYEKGAAYLTLKDPDKAMEAFAKAISLKSDYVEAKYGYGVAVLEKKNYPVAEAAFRDVLKERDEMAEAHLRLGISLYHLKSLDESEKELRKAATMKGGEKLALAHLYLGQILVSKKLHPDAIKEFEQYLELAPNAPNAGVVRSAIEKLKKPA
jgi:tetratricopeptide (TPR) repeat protein